MKRSTWWMIAGVLALIGGLLAIFNPFEGSLTATFIAAWAFMVSGFFCIVAVFTAPGAGNKILFGLFGAISIYLGITLLQNPLAGTVTLTLAAAILIIAGGFFRLFAAFDFKGTSVMWIMLLSSVVSFILGYLILSDFPESSQVTLGILLGVELIFVGISLISLASFTKRVEHSVD